MNNQAEFIAEVEGAKAGEGEVKRRVRGGGPSIEDLPAHTFPGRSEQEVSEGQNSNSVENEITDSHVSQNRRDVGHPSFVGNPSVVENPSSVENPSIVGNSSAEVGGETWERLELERREERERRIYRGRTVGMLRRYMRYSIETGRLPSLLGREFFRSKVTSYTVVTFEDRVIFVIDMERCLDKLDEFSRELIARHILQEHDRWATARLMNCNEKTIRRLVPLVLDVLSEILLEVGLMDRLR